MIMYQLDDYNSNLIRSSAVFPTITSVVTELISNSLDANASNISIEIDGDSLLVTVRDNGVGINSKNLKNHTLQIVSTSKNDLSQRFYGYRGESLILLKFLGNVDIVSKHLVSNHTYQKSSIFNNGKITTNFTMLTLGFNSQGTTVIISNIFHLLPVRVKSLRIDREILQIKEVIRKFSLYYHSVSFEFICIVKGSKKTFLNLMSEPSALGRLSNLFSVDLFPHLTEVEGKYGSFTLSGMISHPYYEFCQPNRIMQYIYVNGMALHKSHHCIVDMNQIFSNVISRYYDNYQIPSQKAVHSKHMYSAGNNCGSINLGTNSINIYPTFVLTYMSTDYEAIDTSQERTYTSILAAQLDLLPFRKCLYHLFVTYYLRYHPDFLHHFNRYWTTKYGTIVDRQIDDVRSISKKRRKRKLEVITGNNSTQEQIGPFKESTLQLIMPRSPQFYRVQNSLTSSLASTAESLGFTQGQLAQPFISASSNLFEDLFFSSKSINSLCHFSDAHTSGVCNEVVNLESANIQLPAARSDNGAEACQLAIHYDDVDSTCYHWRHHEVESCDPELCLRDIGSGEARAEILETEAIHRVTISRDCVIEMYYDETILSDYSNSSNNNYRESISLDNSSNSFMQTPDARFHELITKPLNFTWTDQHFTNPGLEFESVPSSQLAQKQLFSEPEEFNHLIMPFKHIYANSCVKASPSCFNFVDNIVAPDITYNVDDCVESVENDKFGEWEISGCQKKSQNDGLKCQVTLESADTSNLFDESDQRYSAWPLSLQLNSVDCYDKHSDILYPDRSNLFDPDVDFVNLASTVIGECQTSANRSLDFLSSTCHQPVGVASTNVDARNILTATVIGQADSKFIFAMQVFGTILAVDQHAADERCQLESFYSSSCPSNCGTICMHCFTACSPSDVNHPPSPLKAITVKFLLHTRPHRLTSTQLFILTAKREFIEKWGFSYKLTSGSSICNFSCLMDNTQQSSFVYNESDNCMFMFDELSNCVFDTGGTKVDYFVTVISTPIIHSEPLTEGDFFEYLSWLQDNLDMPTILMKPPAVNRILASKACHSAIRFGDIIEPSQCARLLKSLAATQMPLICAHGRPSVFPVAVLSEVLEKQHNIKKSYKKILKLETINSDGCHYAENSRSGTTCVVLEFEY